MTGSRAGTPRTLLEQLLRQRDQTYEEAAAEFADVGTRLGERGAAISPRHLRRLASGERSGTNPITRRVLRAMFDQSAGELLALHQPAPQVDLPANGGTVTRSAPEHEKEVLQMAMERARQFGMAAGKVAVNEETIDQIYDDVRALALAYQQLPLHELLDTLANTQELTFSLLEGPTRPHQGRQLYFLAAAVSGLLARVSHDHANPHAAMTHARTAFVCADNADHLGLQAWVRGLESVICYWANRPTDAVRHAQSGVELGTSNSASVWLLSNEARAWAALGDAGRAVDAIRRAEDAWNAVVTDDLDSLGGVFQFTRPRQLYYAADALAWVPGEVGAAERYATQAVEAYADTRQPGWAFSDQAGSRADLAIARVTRGELDGAEEAITPVLDLPATQRINGIVASTRRLHDAVVHAGLVREATDLIEQIEVFNRRPIATLTQ